MNTRKAIKELIKKGTPKQKAIFLCMEYLDKTTLQIETDVTEEDSDAIKDSLETQKEVDEFNRWVALYYMSTRLSPSIALTRAEYISIANKLLAYVQMWEDYTNEENHLNALYEDLKETGSEKAIEAFHKSVQYIHLEFAEVKIDNEGYVKIDLGDYSDESGFYRIIERISNEAMKALEVYKAGIVTIEKWIDKNDCSEIIPDALKEALRSGKEDYALEIAPQYSKSILNRRLAKGETITEYERERAIFPDYEEVGTDPLYLQVFKNKIEAIEKSEKRRAEMY